MKKVQLLILAGALASATVANATVIYTTDFESPFTVGTLKNQQSWLTDEGASNPISNLYSVSTAQAAAGTQSVSFNTATAAYGDNLGVAPITQWFPSATEKKLTATVKVYVTPGSGNSSSFGLDAFGIFPAYDKIASLRIGANGAVTYVNSNQQTFTSSVTAAAGAWHTLVLNIDYAAGKVTGSVDGNDTGMNLTIPTFDVNEVDLSSFAYGNQTGYFDSLNISSSGNGATVSGNIVLGNYGGTVAGLPAVIKFYNGTTLVDTQNTTLDASGNYTVNTTATGSLKVQAKVTHWLSQSVTTNVSGTTTANFSLTNGDIDGNNIVNINDYARLSDAFNAIPSSSNWDAPADLDGNGIININDYSILSDNFNLVGN